jgi:riboflavin kinase / FMN adenylyltransferase
MLNILKRTSKKKTCLFLLSLSAFILTMKIWNNIESIHIQNPVITIGIFDGVHIGHRFLLDKLRHSSANIKGESVVVTLWPHPRLVLNKDPDALRYLSSIEEKAFLLEQAGIDHLIILEFTKEFSQLDSCEFIKKILVDKIGVKHLLIGYNHKFGRNREGDFNNLKSCADRYGFSIEKAEGIRKGEELVSSTLIRENLLKGDLDSAKVGLGYDYFLQGKVVGGNRIGREIGFPTANIKPNDPHKLIPGDGVYAVNIRIDNTLFKGMLNIGFRPTVNSTENDKTIEVNIFNFDGEIYDKDVSLIFKKRIRDEKKFLGIEQLKQQLVKDREESIRVLEALD